MINLSEWLQIQSIENNDEWNALLGFFNKWISHSAGYREHIEEIFFEMDILPGARRVPLLFFALGDQKLHKTNDFLIRVLHDTLGKEQPFYPVLQRCFESCPQNASIFFAGIHFSRQVKGIRINIKNLYYHQVIQFLKDIGYPGVTAELDYWITFTYSLSDKIRLCIDLGESVLPKVGFECFWDDQPAMETRWEFFLNELVKQDVCLKEKAEAFLSWEKEIFPSLSAKWPEQLWIKSLERPENEFTCLKRKVSHLKISIEPSKTPELKSYLGYGNLWLKINPTRKAVKTPQKQTFARNPDEAIERGLNFILSSQQQSGFWIDFQLPPGKSDEWVTAYTGYYLSFFDDPRINNSLKRAGEILKARYRPGLGWGYNVLTPADADSSLWAYLLLTRIFKTDDVKIYDHSELYLLPQGGVTTYIEEDKIRANTKLDEDASFDGWQSLHLCVTAAYALSGNKHALYSILENQRLDGSVPSYWWTTDEYATALATEAMALDPSCNKNEIRKATDWALGRLQTSLGSPVSSSFNISLLLRILLLSPEVKAVREAIDKGLTYLLESQQENGAWMPSACLRVPMPGTIKPDEATNNWTLTDQNGIFTSITVLTTLDRINKMLH
ncbi:hypothetical protein [Rubrolithibacter danxiaensis]|uniref:hypothetical protein n=1 Tax=Rubrolithibacter danxiaensis TaxID=3390805 RepID=UPI003BF7E418